MQLDIAFDVDLGELTRGHHIVARGLMFGRPVRMPKRDPARLRALMDAADDPNNGGGFIRRDRNAEPAAWEERLTGAELHYEIVPGLSEAEARLGGFDWNWTLLSPMTQAPSTPTTTVAPSTPRPVNPPRPAPAISAARSLPQATRLTLVSSQHPAGNRPARGIARSMLTCTNAA